MFEGKEDSTVVLVSLFCDQYNISREVRSKFGLHNEGIRAISQAEFEERKLELKSCDLKRCREELAPWQSRKRNTLAELEGSTIGSSYPYNVSHAVIASSDMLQSDIESHSSLVQPTGNDILVSENTNGEETLAAEFHVLTSAGSLQGLARPYPYYQDDQKPGILLSETDYVRNSSPPLLDI